MHKPRLLGVVCACLSTLVVTTSMAASIDYDFSGTITCVSQPNPHPKCAGGSLVTFAGVLSLPDTVGAGSSWGSADVVDLFVDMGDDSTDIYDFDLFGNLQLTSTVIAGSMSTDLTTITISYLILPQNTDALSRFDYQSGLLVYKDDTGTIVATNSTDYTGGIIGTTSASVPLPGALWLMSSGLLGFLSIARRKKMD